jgi:uncharacterized membrane protein YhaH (DUF805 family)
MKSGTDETPRDPRQRTPWWFQLMLGIIGLSASMLYLSQALLGEGGGRSWLIGGVWAVFGLLWILSSLAVRARSGS